MKAEVHVVAWYVVPNFEFRSVVNISIYQHKEKHTGLHGSAWVCSMGVQTIMLYPPICHQRT